MRPNVPDPKVWWTRNYTQDEGERAQLRARELARLQARRGVGDWFSTPVVYRGGYAPTPVWIKWALGLTALAGVGYYLWSKQRPAVTRVARSVGSIFDQPEGV